MLRNPMDKSPISEGFINRVIFGVMKTGVATGTSSLIGLFTFILAVRWVSKEELGAFVLFRTIGGVFVMLADMGLGKAATRSIAMAGGNERREIIATAFWIQLLLAGVSALVIFASRPLVMGLFPSQTVMRLYFYLPFFVLATSVSSICRAILQGLHYYGHIAVAQAGTSLLNLALTSLLVLGFGCDILGLVLAVVVSEALSAVYQLCMLPPSGWPIQSLATGSQLLRFGFPLQLNNFLTFLFRGSDALMIGSLLNPVAVASFNVAVRIPERFEDLLQAFISVYYPHMAELFGLEKRQQAATFLNHSLRLLTFAILFIALAVVLFQDSIVETLFTAQYLSSASALALLMTSLAFSFTGNPLGTALVAAGYPSAPALVNLVDAGIHIIAGLAMIPVFGFMGAVYAALLAHAVTNPVLVWMLRRKQIAVQPHNYLLPFAAFTICWLLWSIVYPNLIWERIMILALYMFLSIAAGVVTGRDVSILLQSLGLKDSLMLLLRRTS